MSDELLHRNPESMVPADAGFSHAVEVPPSSRLLVTTGQAGWTKDGTIPDDVNQQCRIAFENIGRLLSDAEMTTEHLVKLTAYLRDPSVVEPYRLARDAFLNGSRPASTVIVVAGFAITGMAIEVEALAAAPVLGKRRESSLDGVV